MGEIADSLINGECDFYTGEYIGDPVGYPRTVNGKPVNQQDEYEWIKVIRLINKYDKHRTKANDVLRKYGCEINARCSKKQACQDIIKHGMLEDFENFLKDFYKKS